MLIKSRFWVKIAKNCICNIMPRKVQLRSSLISFTKSIARKKKKLKTSKSNYPKRKSTDTISKRYMKSYIRKVWNYLMYRKSWKGIIRMKWLRMLKNKRKLRKLRHNLMVQGKHQKIELWDEIWHKQQKTKPIFNLRTSRFS